MSRAGSRGGPILEVMTPHLGGVQIPLATTTTTIGRQVGCGVVLDDPTVSRQHAAIDRYHGGMTLRDLGSSNGTYLNGSRILRPVELRVGDFVSFGSVEARIAVANAESRDSEFDVGNQIAGQINMAGRDQINYIRAERESFLADIAASKTKGRRLVTIGFLFIIAGFGLFGYGAVSFIQAIPDIDINTPPSQAPSPFGPDVGGIPLGVIGFALAMIGTFMLIAGIVLHVGAAARLRRLQNTPWPGPAGMR
jgi:pSer/pThr/pTyr-binding forkhead associated (FHA) protein